MRIRSRVRANRTTEVNVALLLLIIIIDVVAAR